jgi:hypothetical protein
LWGSPAFAQAPALFFSDLESGPNSGGESVAGYSGAYVTLYGNFLGTTQGGSTVTLNGANCLRVVSWGTPHHWYQKIVVQLGGSGSPGGACTTGTFVVTVGGQASNGLPFTVRAGNIRAVKTTANGGNDNNAGTFASPWATIRKCKNTIAAGDICYVGAGVTQTGTEAFEAILNIDSSGSAGNPKAIVGYPGANPQPVIGAGSPAYAIRVPQTGVNPSYWVWANLRINHSSGGPALMTEGTSPVHWRFVGNTVSCPGFGDNKGCVHFQKTNYVYVFGNEITGVGTSPATHKQAHTLYFCSDVSHVWVGWNYIHDNYTCRAIQFHCSDPCTHTQSDLHVYSNYIRGDNCSGINFTASVDPSGGTVEAYNNVILHVGQRIPTDGDGSHACIEHGLSDNPGGSGTIEVYNNTMSDCDPVFQYANDHGAIVNRDSAKTIRLRNNIVYQPLANEKYLAVNWTAGITGDKNLWYGQGNGPTSNFTNNINANPLFVNYTAGDLRLQSASPAIGAALSIPGLSWDLDGLSRPQSSTVDVGAYEYNAGSPAAPPAPTLISVSPLP